MLSIRWAAERLGVTEDFDFNKRNKMKAKQPEPKTIEEMQEALKEITDKLNPGREFPDPRPSIRPFEPFDTQPHVCPNCGHCPTCGRRSYPWPVEDIQWPRRPLPWEYRPNPYWKYQQPDHVMCVG